jgi:hypothetical protein
MKTDLQCSKHQVPSFREIASLNLQNAAGGGLLEFGVRRFIGIWNLEFGI